MAQRSVRRKSGFFMGVSASREYVHQRSPTSSSSISSGSGGSEASCNYDSSDDSDSDDGVRDPVQPHRGAGLTASDIAQRALRELDSLFADMYDNQRAGRELQSSQGGSDGESNESGQEEVSISLEELTIALNAAIERHQPAPDKEEPSQRNRQRRRGGANPDVIDGIASAPPQDVVLPLAHFQDVFQQRIKCFRASKQARMSPISTPEEAPTSTPRQPQEEQQRRWYATDTSRPPPSQVSASSFDGSKFSSSARSELDVGDSECAASRRSREKSPTDAFRRVEMLDQQQQTPQVCMRDQATEIRDLFGACSPASQKDDQADSPSTAVLAQRLLEMEARRSSEHVPPSKLRIESTRAGPTLEDLMSERSLHRVKAAAHSVDGLSSSSSSRSSSLSRSSLSSASSVSRTSEHQSHCSSRSSNQRSKHAPRSRLHFRHPVRQRSAKDVGADEQQPTEPTKPKGSKKTTASKSDVDSLVLRRTEDSAAKRMCSPLWELDLSNFNP